MDEDYKQCPKCEGSGKIEEKDCENCRGKGRVPDWSKDYAPEDLTCLKCQRVYTIPNRKANLTWRRPLCSDCANRMTYEEYMDWYKARLSLKTDTGGKNG